MAFFAGRRSMKKRMFMALAAAILALPAAAQETKRSYAVLSEIAREVQVTIFQEATGTRLGNNIVQRLPIAAGALDKVALVSAKTALGKADAGAPVWLIAPLDTDLFEWQLPFVEGTKVKLPDDLAAEMAQRGTTHLLLFTRLRDAANLRSVNARLGTGQLEGIGFYVDKQTEIKNVDTLVNSVGFIAPYMYVRATLVDARTGTVLKMRRIAEGDVIAAARPDQSGDPWNVMTPNDKVRHLGTMIDRQVADAVAALVPPR
jgi:hypothetical protein